MSITPFSTCCHKLAVSLLLSHSSRNLGKYKSTSLVHQVRQMASTKQTGQSRLRYDGQTAIITGAGRGLGREYALLLASRGANVIVNDFGGDRTGSALSQEKQPADLVVEEIEELLKKQTSPSGTNATNKAIANYESVSDEDGAQQLVDCAIKNFGRVDILINNAGILRDVSFGKLSVSDWDLVMSVHLRGSFLVTRACWPIMTQQPEGGRIIMTCSTSGLYGNFGQANYSAAKMGLLGFSNTLAIEGKRKKVHCNVVVPMAASRLTKEIIPEELNSRLDPKYVAPLVAWLCHRECPETGAIFEAAGGCYARYNLQRSKGKYLPTICDNDSSIETIADNIQEIATFSPEDPPIDSFTDHVGCLIKTFGAK